MAESFEKIRDTFDLQMFLAKEPYDTLIAKLDLSENEQIILKENMPADIKLAFAKALSDTLTKLTFSQSGQNNSAAPEFWKWIEDLSTWLTSMNSWQKKSHEILMKCKPLLPNAEELFKELESLSPVPPQSKPTSIISKLHIDTEGSQ